MFANAQGYERFMGRWSRLMAPLLVDFAGIADGWHVLDAGSGTGSLATTIATMRPRCRIQGIELSPDYVAYAQASVPDAAVRFHAGNVQALPFAAGEFDACVSLLVFNFIPDPGKALTELVRVTRPGGRICAATWDYGEGMQMLRLFWDAARELDSNAERLDEKHMPLCRSGELSALWNATGLVNVEERPLEIPMRFSSFDDLWEPFLGGQGPAGAYVARLEPKSRSQLRDRLKQLLPLPRQGGELEKPAPDAAFELRGRAWAVRGTAPS